MGNNGKSARPQVAVEITAERVVAARASRERDAVELFGARTLPAGAVTPGLQEVNVNDGAALRQAVAGALESVGPHGRDVTVVIPDAAARVMLMEFDTFPEREQEAYSLLRFRLKKLLPFDADRASISYQASRNGNVRVVAAVAALSVVQEYEAALRDTGFSPGVVLPSIAASLGLVQGAEPTLVIKADAGTYSVDITDHGEVRLVRTLEGEPPASPERLGDDIHPLLVFFEDTFGSQIERVLVAGNLRPDAVRAALEAQSAARVQELVSAAVTGSAAGTQVPPEALAGVAGAVLEL